MGHNLQVVGNYSDMHARCSCGSWSKHSTSWEFADGNRVRSDSWEDFADHVRGKDPTAVVCFAASFWGPQIPYNERSNSNMSDGPIFSSYALAIEFIRRGNYVLRNIETLMLPADDPQIDFLLQSPEEQDRRLGIKREG